jgi:hypothetical protein
VGLRGGAAELEAVGPPQDVIQMKTFQQPKQFVHHPQYRRDRDDALAALDLGVIDTPIRGIISAFSQLPHCYTLQSCYGHFLYAGQDDPHCLFALPDSDVGMVRYRIAYIAVCIENSARGVRLCSQLNLVCEVDPEYIQFGSPDWFWERQVNSYALQVEPQRFLDSDVATVDYQEALHVQDVRKRFFDRIGDVLQEARRDIGVA